MPGLVRLDGLERVVVVGSAGLAATLVCPIFASRDMRSAAAPDSPACALGATCVLRTLADPRAASASPGCAWRRPVVAAGASSARRAGSAVPRARDFLLASACSTGPPGEPPEARRYQRDHLPDRSSASPSRS